MQPWVLRKLGVFYAKRTCSCIGLDTRKKLILVLTTTVRRLRLMHKQVRFHHGVV